MRNREIRATQLAFNCGKIREAERLIPDELQIEQGIERVFDGLGIGAVCLDNIVDDRLDGRKLFFDA